MSYDDSFLPPKTSLLANILPEEPLLLMGAGPVPVPVQVSRANGVVINHLGDDMNKVIHGVQEMARYAFQTQSEKVIGISGPSSAGMEMAITNLLWPGRRMLALQIKNGTFSARLGDMAERVGATVTRLMPDEIRPISLADVTEAFSKESYDVVTIVQGETSVGVVNNQLPEIAAFVKAHGALLVVDAVCTLTTMPFLMDTWGIDAAITGGQKGLSSIPGVSLVALSDEAWRVIETERPIPSQWVYDARLAWEFWGHQRYHYTAPVPGILAMYEALRLIVEETLPVRFKRHAVSSAAMQAGIEALGLRLFIDEPMRLPSVLSITVPKNIDPKKWQRHMVDHYGVEIAGSFGVPVVRIGQMGEQCRAHRLFRTLYALGMAANAQGAQLNVSNGMAELEKILEKAAIRV